MARAKRTARADARRRHRALLADEAGFESADDLPSDEAPVTPVAPGSRTASTAGSAPAQTPQRPVSPAGGVRNAFRQAFRPLNLRDDLRRLPQLLAHRAFWLPVLLAAITAGAVVAFQGRELISRFGLTYFVFPPPIGAIFLAGFLAPRASYLIGAMVGIVSSVLFAIVVASVPELFPGGTFASGLLSGLATSPISGVLFAAAAAWYRRFLYLASPARQLERRRPGPSRGRPVRGARPR